MHSIDEIRDRKNGVIKDMLVSLQYTADRQSDLLAFMEQYIKAPQEERSEILEHLRCCMDGKSYPNPYKCHYTKEQVEQCDRLLEDYFAALSSGGVDVTVCAREVTDRLEALNETTGGWLIDTWRKERLTAVIEGAATLAGHCAAPGPVLRHGLD